jgi:hypothetical protein
MEEAAVTAAVTGVFEVISAVDGTEVTVVDGTGEAVTGEDMATPTEHMATPLRLMGMAILITDRSTIQATGTVVITVEGAMVDVDSKKEMVKQTA